MLPTDSSHPIASDRRADPRAASKPRATLSRRQALAIVGALASVLGLGWLADALASLPPGRAVGASRMAQAGTFLLVLTLAPTTPTAATPTSVTIAVRDLADQSTTPARLRGAFGMPAMGMDPVDVAWQALGQGRYRTSVTFPMAGAWTLGVTLTDGSQRTSTATFVIGVR